MAEEAVYLDLKDRWLEKAKSIRELSKGEMGLLVSMFPKQKKLFENFSCCKTCLEKIFEEGDGFWASLLKTYLSPLPLHIYDVKSETIFYRARMFEEKLPKEELENRIKGEPLSLKPFFGYGSMESGAPSPDLVKKAGRCNPIGTSYLYVSSSSKCAANEVIKDSCEYVSIAEMKTKSPLTLIDLSFIVSDAYSEAASNEELLMRKWLCRFFYSVALRFADQETSSAEENPYLLCQTITKAVLSLGLDGIVYKTSKGYFLNECEGLNYVFFDRFAAEAISSKLYRAPLKEDDSFLRVADSSLV